MGNTIVWLTEEESQPAKRSEWIDGNFSKKVKESSLIRVKKENEKWRNFKSKPKRTRN